jgi:hypothetical protein
MKNETYIFKAPVRVPKHRSRNTGSHANEVGLLGKPCCAVCYQILDDAMPINIHNHDSKYFLELKKLFLYFQSFSRLMCTFPPEELEHF